MSATTTLESIPPDRNAPTGTSATIRASTDADRADSNRSVMADTGASRGFERAASTTRRADQYSAAGGRLPVPVPASKVTRWPGRSFETVR